jgi:opacity protein-like surface antigen
MRLARLLVLSGLLLSTASNAWADATLFLGTATAPSNRTTRGFAIGAGLLIIGFEFEYGDTVEDELDAAPSLRTGMGNLLVQTPFAIAGFQPYFTTGAGVYRESLGSIDETNFGINNGGGVKISLIGPVRARVDYRVFSLRGSPIEDTVQRLYVGLNLKF